MKSVNQKYRESGSDLSFRDWLNNQTEQGEIKKKIEPQEMHFNAIGQTTIELFGINIKHLLIGALVITGGIIVYKKYKK